MTAGLRILNLDPDRYAPQASAALAEAGTVDDGPLSRADLLACIGDYDALIMRFAHRIDAELLAAARRLKVIGTNVTGLDHIDLAAAAAHGVTVISLKGETAFLRDIHATAELGWGLFLALLRRLPAAVADVRAGRWARDDFMGEEAAGRRLGILGCGRIGEKTLRYGRAFSMPVHVYDPDPKKADAAAAAGATVHADMAGLLRASDALFIHVPLDPTTRGLIGAAELALPPPGALLVNTSRGAVLDEAALLAALQSGRLAGAALDVLTGEGEADFLARHPLRAWAETHDNLLITPHIGGVARQSWAKTELFVATRVRDRLLGRPPGRPPESGAQ